MYSVYETRAELRKQKKVGGSNGQTFIMADNMYQREEETLEWQGKDGCHKQAIWSLVPNRITTQQNFKLLLYAQQREITNPDFAKVVGVYIKDVEVVRDVAEWGCKIRNIYFLWKEDKDLTARDSISSLSTISQ